MGVFCSCCLSSLFFLFSSFLVLYLSTLHYLWCLQFNLVIQQKVLAQFWFCCLLLHESWLSYYQSQCRLKQQNIPGRKVDMGRAGFKSCQLKAGGKKPQVNLSFSFKYARSLGIPAYAFISIGSQPPFICLQVVAAVISFSWADMSNPLPLLVDYGS